MKLGVAFFIVILIFFKTYTHAQDTDKFSPSVYIGLEPFQWIIGEKGGYVDVAISDRWVLQSYVAYQSWWKNNDEIKQYDYSYISDYILASNGWVFRFSPSYIVSKNEFSFSQILLKPEFTYKQLSYDNKCFYSGSNGMNDIPRQMRSFKSNYFAFNAIFSYRHFDSSYEDVPVEWFIGPGVAIANEDMLIISNGYSGNCTDEIMDERSVENKIYYSLRLGVRVGVRVFQSRK